MTRFYGIEEITFFGNSNQISEFHYVMFHGLAERPGAEKYTPEEHGFGRGAGLPLSITRPGVFFPPLCMPQSNLVVNRELATALRRISNISLLPVGFASLFDVKYKKGDASWYDEGMMPGDPDEFARNAPDERARFEPIPEFFEVLSERYQDVHDKFDDRKRFRLKAVSSNFRPRAEFEASDEMFKLHPIIWNRFTIVSEEVFEVIEPHIDRDFFSVNEAQPM